MTRRRKQLLVAVALALLAAGGFAWYRRATAVDRQVSALLAGLRKEEPGLAERWFIKLGLKADRRTCRCFSDVTEDIEKLGPSAVPTLIRALRDSDIEVRRTAAMALEGLADPRALEPLIAVIADHEEYGDIRMVAARAIGALGDSRGVEPLIAALKDEDDMAPSGAAVALGKLGDRRAFEPLIEALKDGSKHLRRSAAAALGQLGDVRAVEPLLAALNDEGWMVQCNAAAALGELGDPRAIEPLEKLLGDEDSEVREAAAEALARLRQAGAADRP